VQTIVDVKPSEEPLKKEKITIRDLLSDDAEESKTVQVEAIPIPKPDTSAESLDAHFIRDTVVDGTKICVGSEFVQVWTLRNPGPNVWPQGCSVRHVGGDNMLNIDNRRPLSHTDLAEASESNVMPRAINVGEEVQFRVIMKAPQREGTAISYWRLKTPEGIPFGHRLWCDIAVVAPPSPVSAPQSVPLPAPIQPAKVSPPAPRVAPASVPVAPRVAPASNPLYERLLQARAERMRHAQHTQQQQLDQQKMERIQRVRKAAVERLLDNRRREHEAALATIKHDTTPYTEPTVEAKAEPTAVVPEVPEVTTAELPVEEKTVVEKAVAEEMPVVEEKTAKHAPEPQASGMIFPQLDKESPESSTYESSTTAQPVSPMSEKSTIARTVTMASDDEFFEDAESVALHSDDGFMTDEEYDILDASDEEMP
jgi:next-to-BRCA1 protein 1